MKKRIIQMTIGFTALVVSFLLPKKAQESFFCSINCQFGSCSMFKLGEQVACECSLEGEPVCGVS